MKYITLIIGLLVVGCGKAEPELTVEEKVVGEYEHKDKDGNIHRYVFLENGIVGNWHYLQQYRFCVWTISNGELHVNCSHGFIMVERINTDKSVSVIASLKDGERTDYPEYLQHTWKKIK